LICAHAYPCEIIFNENAVEEIFLHFYENQKNGFTPEQLSVIYGWMEKTKLPTRD
jgi:hypothetical protein